MFLLYYYGQNISSQKIWWGITALGRQRKENTLDKLLILHYNVGAVGTSFNLHLILHWRKTM